MENISNFILPFLLPLQVFFLITAIVLILLQNRGAGLSSTFGGGGDVYLTRRGIEKWVVRLTVAATLLFMVLRIGSLYL